MQLPGISVVYIPMLKVNMDMVKTDKEWGLPQGSDCLSDHDKSSEGG